MEMALQFKAGDYMMYGTVGVCQVKEISRLSFMRDKKLYYTLVPVFDRGSMIYIPVDNQKVVMRPVISREEAEVFIEQLPKFMPTVTNGCRPVRRCWCPATKRNGRPWSMDCFNWG